MCGLKLIQLAAYHLTDRVTPFVGVWIETYKIKMHILPTVSHPSWVCGLKLTSCLHKIATDRSHPSWVCGLKRYMRLMVYSQEKSHPSWVCGLKRPVTALVRRVRESHPSWVCGLKRDRVIHHYIALRVTPFVGVWIETIYKAKYAKIDVSHPSWVCGLKH